MIIVVWQFEEGVEGGVLMSRVLEGGDVFFFGWEWRMGRGLRGKGVEGERGLKERVGFF